MWFHFQSIVQDKNTPDDIKVGFFDNALSASGTVSQFGFGNSNSEIKRVISQGGFQVNEQKITDPNKILDLKDDDIIKYGKRQFGKVARKK